MDEDSQQAYAADIKRQRDTYGPDAETPRTPYGNLKVGSLTTTPRPVTERLADLCKRLPGVSQQLAYARTRQRESDAFLRQADAAFKQVAEALLQVIHEHREGTPENGAFR